MKQRKIFSVISLLIVFSMILAACQAAATETPVEMGAAARAIRE